MIYDIIIIGGGVAGCAIAHEAVQYNLKVLLLEKVQALQKIKWVTRIHLFLFLYL